MSKIIYFAPLILAVATGCASVNSSGEQVVKPTTFSQASDKCDADYLNSTYATLAYRYKVLSAEEPSNGWQRKSWTVYDIKTVSMNELPASCAGEPIKYVGEPLKGGFWVPASLYESIQKQWEAKRGRQWSMGWDFSWDKPNRPSHWIVN